MAGQPIADGKGENGPAEVTARRALVAKAIVISEQEDISEQQGQTYFWTSGKISIDAADTVLLVKNTSDVHLHITLIEIENGSTASEYTVHLPTTEVTPAGNAVTGTNVNTASTNVADATAKSDETNNTQGTKLHNPFMAVDSSRTYKTEGLILAKNKSLAVDVVATVTETSVTIEGHYE